MGRPGSANACPLLVSRNDRGNRWFSTWFRRPNLARFPGTARHPSPPAYSGQQKRFLLALDKMVFSGPNTRARPALQLEIVFASCNPICLNLKTAVAHI